MHVLSVGWNHRKTPVDVRERLSFDEDHLTDAHQQLNEANGILEAAILSTCNRTELYVVAEKLHTGRYYIENFLSEWFEAKICDFSPFAVVYEDTEAVEHLFRVASGLDSMVLGESQIIGQVRDAFFTAQNAGTTGTMLNEIFKRALTLAKKGQTETGIGQHAVSISYAAVQLGKRIFGGLHKKNVLIIGAGEMSELALKHLYDLGNKNVMVANRTYERAEALAKQFSGSAIPFRDIPSALISSDILITSTNARSAILNKEDFIDINRQRKGRPLFIVDIAVPRDVAPDLHEMDNVYLYDIDDLEGIVSGNLARRREEAKKVESLIDDALIAYQKWEETLGVVPVVTALREKGSHIQEEVMKSIDRKLPHLSEHERKLISKHMMSVVNQLLRDPVNNMKEMAGESYTKESLDFITKLFAIEEGVAEAKDRQKQRNDFAKVERGKNQRPSWLEKPSMS